MEKQERMLFKALCSFEDKNFDKTLVNAATPSVLGYLFFNRMQSVAYGVLNEKCLLGKINREFRNSLKSAYKQNCEKNKSFFQCVKYLENILSKSKCKYAMLKGAYLCQIYPEGYRTSNDIDLLVASNDVSTIGDLLTAAGFKQGYIRNEVFIPATRREIIESKMMRGETVPYIKEVNLPYMKYLEVDINFSLDYKPGDNLLLKDMLERTELKNVNGFNFRTLCNEDFFIHLCSHLYKEATTLPWIEMKRDMTLYKYADIYMLLNNMTESEVDALLKRAKDTETADICAFAIIQMSKLFNCKSIYPIKRANAILKNNKDFIHTVISPKERKTYIFTTKNIVKRFFMNDRRILLKEVQTK